MIHPSISSSNVSTNPITTPTWNSSGPTSSQAQGEHIFRWLASPPPPRSSLVNMRSKGRSSSRMSRRSNAESRDIGNRWSDDDYDHFHSVCHPSHIPTPKTIDDTILSLPTVEAVWGGAIQSVKSLLEPQRPSSPRSDDDSRDAVSSSPSSAASSSTRPSSYEELPSPSLLGPEYWSAISPSRKVSLGRRDGSIRISIQSVRGRHSRHRPSAAAAAAPIRTSGPIEAASTPTASLSADVHPPSSMMMMPPPPPPMTMPGTTAVGGGGLIPGHARTSSASSYGSVLDILLAKARNDRNAGGNALQRKWMVENSFNLHGGRPSVRLVDGETEGVPIPYGDVMLEEDSEGATGRSSISSLLSIMSSSSSSSPPIPVDDEDAGDGTA
jgi:hypothetical protein